MKPKLKIWHGRITLIVFSLIAVVTLIEIAMRVYGFTNGIDFRLYLKELKNSNRLPEEIYSDSGVGMLEPNSKGLSTTSDYTVMYSINSQGFRDKEYSYDKPSNRTRISMYGDSFTFGEGIPYGKRFADITESKIPDIEILNFGVPGLGLDQMVTQIFRDGFLYQPDYVFIILNRYVMRRGFPDISTILEYSATETASIIPAPVNTLGSQYVSQSDTFFNYHPNIIFRISNAASYLYYLYAKTAALRRMADYDKQFWTEFRTNEVADPHFDRVFGIDIRNRNVQLLDKLHSICMDKGCKLVGINIDTKPLEEFYGSDPPFAYYDLSAEMNEESKKHTLTFKYDLHYNEKTNVFLSQLMTPIIEKIISQKDKNWK